MTGFNIREKSYIHKSLLFGFLGSSDDAIVINYCILHSKHYIYLEKLKDDNKKSGFNADFLWYLCHLKHIVYIQLYKIDEIYLVIFKLLCRSIAVTYNIHCLFTFAF